MTEHVERLNASHFEEAMAFLNEVFAVHGPHDFARMLPGVYRPDDEHMRHNLGMRRNGRLVSVVGVFPLTLDVQGQRLRVAGIGGVSVARDQQGQGLLERMMLHARAAIEHEGYQLSFLNGGRQRYRRFGWEVTGAALRVTIGARNLRHAFRGSPAPDVSLEPLAASPDQALVHELRALHDAQPMHVERKASSFARLLQSWHYQPLVARDQAGALLGYASVLCEKGKVGELVARSSEAAITIVRGLTARCGGKLCIDLCALPGPLTDELGRIAERVELCAGGNWQIWDFPAVIAALLRARHAARALPDGRVVVKASGGAESLELWVEGDRAGCDPSSAAPHLEAPRDELVRMLCGPLPPALVGALPRAAAVLSSWCPLPLALPLQDQV